MDSAEHLYVHVPFCSRRCSYCDFAIAVRRDVPVQEYLGALAAELELRLAVPRNGAFKTVYLGGGTPSKLGFEGVTALLGMLRSAAGFGLEADAEITIEANPEDVSGESVRAWMAAGVNRLSLGAQSFDNRVLEWMHRTHDGQDVGRAVSSARDNGLADISLDLIFALPSDLERDWGADLRQALDLRVEHVSLYGLTVEPRSPLGRWTARGEVSEAPEERYAEEFLQAHETLGGAGFEHYEVSNFARSGRRSRHNSSYWRRVPYLGLGPSAHSYDGAARRWNAREYRDWLTRVTGGHDPVEGTEILSPENELSERVYLGLRTMEGLAVADTDAATVEIWVRAGWARQSAGRVVLTAEGWLRLDGLAAALTAIRSR